jgi:hypothetical protein
MDPRARASALLEEVPARVWDGASLPVPVERIADSHCRLFVREVKPAVLSAVEGAPGAMAISGLLLVEDRQIWVNAEEAKEWPGRKRFTIGHELGHWCLHRPSGSLFCRTSEVDPVDSGPDIEEEASLFGAALMFPPDLVREHHARLGSVAELQDLFGSTRTATARAVCFAVRGPQVAAIPEITMFHHDDPGYEAWRDAHLEDGWVLNDDLGDGREAKLHDASCHYLHRAPKEGQPRTRQPKLCSLQVAALRELLPLATECGCVVRKSRSAATSPA